MFSNIFAYFDYYFHIILPECCWISAEVPVFIPWTEFTLAWKTSPNKFVSSSSRGSWIELWNFWTSFLQPNLPFRPPSSPSCPPPSWQPWSMFVLTSFYFQTFSSFCDTLRDQLVTKIKIRRKASYLPQSASGTFFKVALVGFVVFACFRESIFSSSPPQFE